MKSMCDTVLKHSTSAESTSGLRHPSATTAITDYATARVSGNLSANGQFLISAQTAAGL